MNDLPRQKLKEIIIQYGRDLCDNPKRCEAFLNDYCGQYRREIFLLISALKQGVAKDLLNSGNIPVEVLLGRLINQMQNDLGLTKEAAQYAVESWAQALDKMPPPSKYTKLETLLKAQKFKEADEETRSVMLAVANRQSEGYLRVEDAENFPCEELRTIDNLWLKYSQGKFSFSVQQEIYKSLGGTKQYDEKVWRSFGDRIGWRSKGSWLNYNELNFSLSAPTGQLPWGWVLGVSGWGDMSSLLLRHVECNP